MRTELPTLEEARGWVGFRVDGMEGSSVARVQGVFADVQSGEAVWVIAKIGRFGKVIAIPFRDCAGGVGHVWVPFDRDVLRSSPSLDALKPLTREQELMICEHYGIREEVGRAAEVAPRPEGEITSQAPGEDAG